MQIRTVYFRQRDRPPQAHTAPKRQQVIKDTDKAGNESTEPFRAVLMRVTKEGGRI